MSFLTDLLAKQLGGSVLREISSKLGISEKLAGPAVSAAVPLLLGALSRNASKDDDGAKSLGSALNKDHDGGILDNLPDFIGKGDKSTGDGILGHVLGSRRSTVETGLSRAVGIESKQSSDLMSMLAPVVMGAVGKTKREQGVRSVDLGNFLRKEEEEVRRRAPASKGLAESLLDKDGDGDVDLKDLAGGLGGLFG